MLTACYIDLNSFFASVEQQRCPDLRGEPVAVVPVMTDGTSVIAASYEAKAFGVKTGTLVADAKRMCPGLNLILADHKHYVEFHERIGKAIDTVIPVAEVCSIDEFYCKTQGQEQTREGAAKLAAAIKAAIAAEVGPHVRASIGFAPNKYLAKVATDMHKPDGLTMLDHDDLPHKLYDLQLRDLPGVGWSMEKRLNDAGVHSVRQLLSLQSGHLRKLWNSVWGERMYCWLRGEQAELPEPGDRASIGHSHVIDPKLRPIALAHTIACRLLLKAASRLRRMDYHASGLDLSARIENGARLGYRASFPHACDNHAFFAALQPMWQQLLRDVGPRARVKKLSLTLHGLLPAGKIQPDLFDAVQNGSPQRAEKLSRAMDALNARFGRDTVVMGFTPDTVSQFSGTKIAFTRVPDLEEFHE